MRTVTALALGALVTLRVVGQNDGASITGRVTDFTGAVISAAQAELRSESNAVVVRGTTGATGVYVFDSLIGGDYTLRLISPGFASLTLKSIHIANGEHTTLPNLQLSVSSGCGSGPVLEYLRILKPPREVGDVCGSVRLDLGPMTGDSPPISDAHVDLLCGRSPCRTTTTDSQGRFLFKDVLPGEYVIRVSHAGLYPKTESGYAVQDARELTYYPIYLERCFRGNCNPTKRPKKPLLICE